jgi:hypothetical protein
MTDFLWLKILVRKQDKRKKKKRKTAAASGNGLCISIRFRRLIENGFFFGENEREFFFFICWSRRTPSDVVVVAGATLKRSRLAGRIFCQYKDL